MNQSDFEASTCNRRQTRENVCERGTIGFGFTFVLLLIGWEIGASFVDQSRSEVKQNQSKRKITFDIQL